MISFFSTLVSTNAELFITLAKILLLLFIVLTVNAYLTWFERKVVAHMQSRWGPHRTGPHGLLQPLADGLKFFFKLKLPAISNTPTTDIVSASS